MYYKSWGVILYLGIVLVAYACKYEPIELDYCKMLTDDQSYVNNDKSDLAKFESDKAKRTVLLANNFDLLISKTKQDGFPSITQTGNAKDSCQYKAVEITMIHAAQSNTKLFYSDKVSQLFSRELKKGNLDQELLKKSSIIAAKTVAICHDLQLEIERATQLWGIDYSIFEDANFVDCNNPLDIRTNCSLLRLTVIM